MTTDPLTNVERAAKAESYRVAYYRGHPAWARWGRFSSRIDGDIPHVLGPIVCGVCGLDFDAADRKAEHLRIKHGAAVIVVESDAGESLYEWTR